MSVAPAPTGSLPSFDADAVQTVRILTALCEGYAGALAVRLWTGETWQPNPGPAAFTVVLKHGGALRAMFWPFDKMGLGEAYVFDDFDIEGDIFAFTGWLKHMVRLKESRSLWSKLRLLRGLSKLPKRCNPRDPARIGRPVRGDHSRANDREAISFAYDLPGDFYALWLDKYMPYTCAYILSPGDRLDAAQEQKVDFICWKLRLQPAGKFVDFGYGWSGLPVHAAKHYGVFSTKAGANHRDTEAQREARGRQEKICVPNPFSFRFSLCLCGSLLPFLCLCGSLLPSC